MLPNLSTLATLALGAASLVSAQSPYPVTGVGAVAVRRNINDLQSQGGPAWDLYIRALNDIQNNRNINDPFSFFQIAGIHGKPYIEWDGTGAGSSDGWQGYCPHGERLFLTWHRPYVVLYEQILVATAQRLAREYPSNVRNSYIQAANNLRSPYWDWALQQGVPQATVPSQITVTAPNSRGTGTTRITINNPLNTFRFPTGTFNGNYGDMTYNGQRLTRTYRCNGRGQSYPNTANQQLGQRTYKQWVYDAFTSSNTFDQFASTAANNGVSLEQIHNAIHWDAACGGQFLTADYSGFDPIFMLHHTNVDRMWAYWQSIHPDQAVFTSSYSGGARWSTPSGSTISPNSPLAPFYMDSSNMHSSRSVVNFTQFGYTYDQLDAGKSRTQLQQDATRLINTMYSNGQTMTRRDGLKLKKRGKDTYTRFFAHVEVDVTEVEKPCTVNVYLDGKQIDQHIVMMQPASGNSHGGYSMDEAIKAGLDEGQEVDDVLKSVLSKLTVAVVKHDGTNTPVHKVPSLKLNIQHVEVTPPESDCVLPSYENSKMTAAKVVQQPCGCESSGDSSGNVPSSTAPASTDSGDYAAPSSAAPAATGDSSGEAPADYATTSSAPAATGDSSGSAPADTGSDYGSGSGSGSGSGYVDGSIGGSASGNIGGSVDGTIGGIIGGDVNGIIGGSLGGHAGVGVGYGRKRHARG